MGVSPFTITPSEQGKNVHFLTILIQQSIRNPSKYKKGKKGNKRHAVQCANDMMVYIENIKESTLKIPRTIK